MKGLCECRCGQPAPIASRTHPARGWVKGQPLRFVRGHSRRHGPIRDRLLARTVVRPGSALQIDGAPCWEWTGATARGGYGQIRLAGRMVYVHRVAYEIWLGPVPGSAAGAMRGDGLDVDHLCRNRLCVNPAHLEAVTSWVNNVRSLSPSAVNAAKTHCIRQHKFSEMNTYVRADGSRDCRPCRRERRAGCYQRQLLAA